MYEYSTTMVMVVESEMVGVFIGGWVFGLVGLLSRERWTSDRVGVCFLILSYWSRILLSSH